MPILKTDHLKIDYIEQGNGNPVILIHSSVSANRQWRILMETLSDRYKLYAINLYGYGGTTDWPANRQQSLYAQSILIKTLCENIKLPVSLIGHSFGGSVALKSALLLNSKIDKLILLEPNPFYLLQQHHRTAAYLEACQLCDHVKCFGAMGDWQSVAYRFADYWLGDGSWDTMPENRKTAFIESLPPNYHEWDSVMNEHTPVEIWNSINAKTLVVSDKNTRAPINEIVEIFRAHCPSWSFKFITAGGHMAALTHPEIINPVISAFLQDGGTQP